MKNISGTLRIYIVLSCVWFVYFLDEINLGTCLGALGFNNDGTKSEPASSFIEGFISCNSLTNFISFIPIPLYFVLKWVSEGFKNK
tara:strand:- start:139 stop:396 length:258 start_codon:yes stop_codon:yes gene_type:complete